MSSRLRALLVPAVAAIIVLATSSSYFADAAKPAVKLRISGISIAPVLDPVDGQSRHEVVVQATVTNNGDQPVSDEVELITGRALFTRSQLDDVIQTRSATGLSGTTAQTTVKDLAPGATTTVELRLGTRELWGQSQQGVFPVGVQSRQSAASDVIATGWFGEAKSLAPTQVTFAVPLTSNVHEDANVDAQEIITAESQRLNNLVNTKSTETSFILDPYAVTLLNSSTDVFVRKVAARLGEVDSTPSIYAQANLARLNVGNQVRAISRALQLTPHTSSVLYLPKSEKTDIAPYGDDFDSQIIPVINNNFVAGDKLETIDASASRSNGRALVFDQSISECLVMKSAFDTSWCLTSQLAMVTAESPNVSRAILIVAPTQWNPTAAKLNAINSALITNEAFSMQSLSKLLASEAVTVVGDSSRLVPFDASLRKVERDVLKAQTSTRNVFGDIPTVLNLSSVATQLYSQNWKSSAAAKHFGRTYAQNAHELLNGIRLEGSRRITIPGTQADLPVTVFNSTDLAAKVIVNVNGSGSSRISAQLSDLVTVEPGSRVTVQIPIQLNSSSSVLAKVQLTDSNGKSFGNSLTIEIASTAYQQFARSLVWLALIALVLLVGNNVWRRTRKSHAD